MLATPKPELQPIAVSIPEASRLISRCVATIYALLTRGEITAIKSDGRTLVLVNSLHAYIDRCPKAEFKTKQSKPMHLRQAEAARSRGRAPDPTANVAKVR
jgi:hypothetical protein